MSVVDIFNPQVSVVAHGLEGKVILVYGSNSLGKTKQATMMRSPFYLPFETGINAIAGIPFAPINTWSDFKKINKQLTSPATVEKARELYQTIIFDEVEASARYCQKYICDKYESDSIASGREGFGLWKEYETEYWAEINKLLGVGYTVVFIAHQGFDKELDIIYPKGDKRAIAPVVDNSDVIIYLQSNGIDEKRRVIKSTGYTAQTDKFFARSRFDYIDTVIPEYTAENLEAVLIDAIKRQEKAEGIKAVNYSEQKSTQQSEDLNYENLVAEINTVGKALQAKKRIGDATVIIEKHLGKDKKVKDATKAQVQVLAVILDELKELQKEVDKDVE